MVDLGTECMLMVREQTAQPTAVEKVVACHRPDAGQVFPLRANSPDLPASASASFISLLIFPSRSLHRSIGGSLEQELWLSIDGVKTTVRR